MKNGFKVFDTDTHVMPAAEVIERYVDPVFRPRLQELEPYRTPMRQSAEYQSALHGYRIQPQFYRRVLGEGGAAAPTTGAATRCGWARRCRVPACRTTTPPTASPTWTTRGPTCISSCPAAGRA